jgi:quinol---cytochrome-c reductase cytochrome c subunit
VRELLRNRFLLPAALMVAMGIGGMFSLTAGAGASGSSTPTTTPVGGLAVGGGVGSGDFNSGVALPPSVGSPCYLGGPRNSGGPNSTIRTYHCVHGHQVARPGRVIAYGNSAIIYKNPPKAFIPAGEALFAENCSSCHGDEAQGSAIAPNLRGVGPATVDFWVSTGRMPAQSTAQVEAERKPARLTPLQALEVAAWVNSLDPAVPYVPYVNTARANVSVGAALFSLNCAACHTITGSGDALAYGTNAPTLNNKHITPQQVAEAIRTGPANMPRFTGNLNDAQVRDLVAYVTRDIQHPDDAGGFGLGGVGPVTEGFIGLLLGVGGLALICYWIGDRT